MDPTIQTLVLPFEDVQQALDAMLWVINPYLDDDSLADYPYFVELTLAYNSIVKNIPAGYKHCYVVINLP